MKSIGVKNASANLANLGIQNLEKTYWNLSPNQLTAHTMRAGQGLLSDTGALVIKTGKFTGRSPNDRYIVKDGLTANSVDWGTINTPFSPRRYDELYQKVTQYLEGKAVYVKDAYACADEKYRLNIRLVSEYAWSNLFAHNMFLRPSQDEIRQMTPDWTIICVPSFLADPLRDGTRNENFAIINFSKQQVLIGGTGYTGEIKKSIFSVLNYILPLSNKVLSMHCSANVGEDGDVAIFFGLSGTGKTTLSASANRKLIGDDEHGWSDKGIFNFEGGCYAKCIDLSKEKEPEIYDAIHAGALLENMNFCTGTNKPDYTDDSITQNTRVSYPIYHIDNHQPFSKAGHPKHIFFLTCDAFGVLPPVSKLTPAQAMYHFISGYTAKVAGTEEGINEPKTAFSACFGAPFLPLHPTHYAEMLSQKIKKHQTHVWLINTGWIGGAYGEGHRIALKYTRAIVNAILENQLNDVPTQQEPIFGLHIPTTCPNIPNEILNPRNTWADKYAYDDKANSLAIAFHQNFEKYEAEANAEILSAAPRILEFA